MYQLYSDDANLVCTGMNKILESVQCTSDCIIPEECRHLSQTRSNLPFSVFSFEHCSKQPSRDCSSEAPFVNDQISLAHPPAEKIKMYVIQLQGI